MKKKVIFTVVFVLFLFGIFLVYNSFWPKEYIIKNTKVMAAECDWNNIIAYSANQYTLTVDVDGYILKSNTDGLYLSDELVLMMPTDRVREAFDCAVNTYKDCVVVERGLRKIQFSFSQGYCLVDDKVTELVETMVVGQDRIMLPCDVLCNVFGFNYDFDMQLNKISITNTDATAKTIPFYYNYEDVKRAPATRNQGNLGTCWAFAALTAVESTLLPDEEYDFSIDHMSIKNSFNLKQSEGGDYSMSMAYLLAWQGPVNEEDDPYGDGYSPDGLTAVKHVQEVQFVDAKDYEKIKKMIFKYGGVQSSFYASVLNDDANDYKYYNDETKAYCYIGTEKPNHDIVIIGWDDNYSKSNFNMEIEGDGAFICRNSWGSDFGNNGNFYISYYDTNIGVHNVVYTKVEPVDNYDNIYQSDYCGYVGQLGYGKEDAYFANAYTAEDNEELKAVGFYATGNETEYSVYVCENFKDADSLSNRSDPIATGRITNSGYYTIPLENSIQLKKGQKYAIIVRVITPNGERPVAVEFANDTHTSTVSLDDGEGYVSYKGITWERTEETHGCNVCLKAYTSDGV